MSIENIIGPFIVGLILLFFEHRTKWFEKQLEKSASKQIFAKITTNQWDINSSIAKWVISTTLIVAAITTIVVNQYIGRELNFANTKLQFYEQSEEWKLPETIKALGEASQTINLSIEERKQFEEQKNSLLEAENRVSQLEMENKDLQKKVEALEALLLPPAEEFEISKGETKPMIGDSYYLGITNVYDTYVTMNLNNNFESLDVGQSTNLYATGGISCKLILLGIQDSKARFSFRCE